MSAANAAERRVLRRPAMVYGSSYRRSISCSGSGSRCCSANSANDCGDTVDYCRKSNGLDLVERRQRRVKQARKVARLIDQ